MVTKIRQWVMPPTFEEDKDKSRASILLNIILGVFFISALGYGLLVPIVPEMRIVRAAIIIPFLLILIFLKYLLNRGYIQIVGTLIVFALWFVFTTAMLSNPDYNNPAYMGYLVVVICAGLVLNWSATMAWSLFIVLTNAVILLLEYNHVIPNSDRTASPIVFWMAQTLYIFVSAFLLSQALRKVDEALERSQRELIDRQHAESALREAEHNYRSIFENATEGILRIAADGRTILTNPAAARMLGYDSPEEVLAAVPNIIAIYVEPARRAAFRRELETHGQARDFEVQLYHKSGRRIWVSLDARAVRDAHGTVLFHEGFARDITKRKQAEEELLESEERYRAVVENQTEFIVRWKPDGTRTFVNEAYCRYFELTYDQAVSTSFLPLLAEDDRAAAQLRILRLTSGAANLESYVQRVNKPDGSLCWQEWTDQGIWDESNQFVEFQSVGRDITDRMKAEIVLSQFRNVMDESNDAIFLIDPVTGQYIDFNRKAHEFLGYTRDELGQLSIAQVAHHIADMDAWHARVTLVQQQEGLIFETIYQRKDGTAFPVEVSARMLSYGERTIMVGIVRDISDRKRAEEALQKAHAELEIQVQERTAALSQANALLETLMDNVPDHIFFKDLQSQFIRTSRSQALMLGLSHAAEAVGKSDFDFFPHAQKSYEDEQAMIKSGMPMVDFEEFVVWPNGRETWVSTTKVPLRDSTSRIIGTFGIARDITERKRAEEGLRKAKAELEVMVAERTVELRNSNEQLRLELAERKRVEEKLRQQAGQMSALYDIGLTITSNLDLDQILHDLFEKCRQLLPIDTFYIAVYDDSTGTIRHPLFYDGNQKLFIQVEDRNIETAPGLSGHVILSKTTLRLQNLGDPAIQEKYEIIPTASLPASSYLGVPMLFHDSVVGVLSMQSYEPDAYSPEQIRLLETIATQAAIAIENARLYESEQKRRQEAETLRRAATAITSTLDSDMVMKEIFAALKQVIPYDSGSVFLHEGNQLRIVMVQGYPDPQKLMNRTFPADDEFFQFVERTRRPIVVTDAQKDPRFKNWGESFQIQGWMAIPLIARGKVIGGITLDNLVPGGFDEASSEMALAFASQATAAIENARLYEAEQERRQEAETLRESLASIVTTFELDEVVERILDQIKFVIPYDTASVWRVDGEWLRPIVGRDIPPEVALAEMRLRIDGDNSSRPMIHGEKPYLLNNNVQEELKDFTGPHSYINSWLAVPLKKRGKIIGQISLDGRKKGQFTAHHAELAVTFADQVAIALENASLYEEIQQELLERKRAEESLRTNEEKIRELNASLEKRVMERTEQLQAEKARIERVLNEVATLRRLSDFLQASMTVEEACQIIISHMNSLFSSTSGALYLTGDGFADLSLMAHWGDVELEPVIQPDDCWGMRRGRVFVRRQADAAPACIHFGATLSGESMCLPLLAQNETIGMLCMQVPNHEGQYFNVDVQNLAVASTDSIALALANLRLRERLRDQSIRDPLTGLFNRRYLEETLAREVHRASRSGNPLCVIMFEVDNFKIYNNTYGHDAGDYVLRKVADTMRVNLRRSDFPCRYGGDEFTLILPDTNLADGAHRAEELRKAVEALALSFNNQALGTVTVRMGVAAYPQHGDSGEAVLQVADDASYRARAIGKNCVVVAE